VYGELSTHPPASKCCRRYKLDVFDRRQAGLGCDMRLPSYRRGCRCSIRLSPSGVIRRRDWVLESGVPAPSPSQLVTAPSSSTPPVLRRPAHRRRHLPHLFPPSAVFVFHSKHAPQQPSTMKVTIREWNAVAAWRWDMPDDDVCGICRNPYDSTCSKCKFPGDECPLRM
jgi:hypothetical protein